MKEKRYSQLRHQMINGKEYKIEKMNFARDNNPRSGFLKLGDDPIMLDYLSNNKVQQHYPYYWVDANNNVRCHCFGNPIAKCEAAEIIQIKKKSAGWQPATYSSRVNPNENRSRMATSSTPNTNNTHKIQRTATDVHLTPPQKGEH